jgi:adenine-specific DNA-methyltransferase
VIKYIGSKRLLVDRIVEIARATGAKTACDLFTGTTRVAQGLKRAGMFVHANDYSGYSEVLARTYIEADPEALDVPHLERTLDQLNALPGVDGYVTETFCREARYFQPKNGMRIDAIRAGIDELARNETERAIFLTSLLLAADRVDSTTGVQMAYLKQWSARSHNDLHLKLPELIAGAGKATRSDANKLAPTLDGIDLAYLDPPYNQHSYYSNYHVWESIVANDRPDTYGIARKRVDCREIKSDYNSKRRALDALADVIENVNARWVLTSFSNEGFHTLESLTEIHERRHETAVIEIDHPRYVGARIGIHNPQGEKVGSVSHVRNTEYLFLTGPGARDVANSVSHATAV